jgi:hypothetical protein
MLAAAIDVLLKILIWEDAHGTVRVSHNRKSYSKEGLFCRRNCCKISPSVETLAARAGE